ncbi:MAG: PIN domain nuclease [Leptonema illini]|uniref:Ribonuclease VapC n=1 Tax=Leptonema illini TaxID=183 RepID=A0A833GZW0_9LEPT|nr:MAG: PIN domain nuclease [Leptonema illini]
MMLVDSSVWIDFFNGKRTPESDLLESALGNVQILIGDLIYMEVLQGFKIQRDFNTARRLLDLLEFKNLGGKDTVLLATDLFRTLRSKGITVRKTVDTVIAAFCIQARIPLLHRDRDFDPFEKHCGLKAVRTGL